jgi:protein-tyrosine phosphatase
MDQRIVSLEGVDNFRDFGGYHAAGGRRIRPGRLYRSAHHGQATDADLAAIAALDIAVIVDLRRAEERQRFPSRRHDDFAAAVIDNDIDDVAADPWFDFIKGSDGSEASFRGYLLDYYRDAPFVARHVDLFSRYFRALGETDGPVLIHCAAGKDRTGMLAALTHSLMGVHEDDIFADFLLTNTATPIDRRLPVAIETIAGLCGRTPTEAAVRTAMGVDTAYLERAFAAIEDRHGSVAAYLESALGVDAALRERIETRLVG